MLHKLKKMNMKKISGGPFLVPASPLDAFVGALFGAAPVTKPMRIGIIGIMS